MNLAAVSVSKNQTDLINSRLFFSNKQIKQA